MKPQTLTIPASSRYVVSPDLLRSFQVARLLGKPLLLKGEPGTGKTTLAEVVAAALGVPLVMWSVKSTTKAQHGLYDYDAIGQLSDANLLAALNKATGGGDAVELAQRLHQRVVDPANYVRRGKMWEAFTLDGPPVLLIDEIDKADVEFPNDLLHELDRMEFEVRETGLRVQATKRPIVIITSNNERELPGPFLRRCVFHFISFPNPAEMARIVDVHHPKIKSRLRDDAIRAFYELRDVSGLTKPPSTSELIEWLHVLASDEIDVSLGRRDSLAKLPLLGVLLKHEADIERLLR